MKKVKVRIEDIINNEFEIEVDEQDSAEYIYDTMLYMVAENVEWYVIEETDGNNN